MAEPEQQAIDINTEIVGMKDGTIGLRITMLGFPSVAMAETFSDIVREAFEAKLNVPIEIKALDA